MPTSFFAKRKPPQVSAQTDLAALGGAEAVKRKLAKGIGSNDSIERSLKALIRADPQDALAFLAATPQLRAGEREDIRGDLARVREQFGLELSDFTSGSGGFATGGPTQLVPPTGGPSTTIPGGPGGIAIDNLSPGGFQGGAAAGLTEFANARPTLLRQQQQLLEELGPGLRDAVFTANPELAAVSGFLTSRVQEGTPEDLEAGFASRFQQALAGQGFTGGGTGPAFQQAQYLTALSEQNRFQAAQQLQGLGFGIQQTAGLGAPQLPTFGEVGGLSLSERQFAEQTRAGREQSQFAQQIFNQLFESGAFSGGNVASSLPFVVGGRSAPGAPTPGPGGFNAAGQPVNQFGIPVSNPFGF